MSPAPWLIQKSMQAWASGSVSKSEQLRVSPSQGQGPLATVVCVAVGVVVGVLVWVGVLVAVPVAVGVLVWVGDPVDVGVDVSVGVAVAVPVAVGVAVSVAVGVIAGATVNVNVGVSCAAPSPTIKGNRVSASGINAPNPVVSNNAATMAKGKRIIGDCSYLVVWWLTCQYRRGHFIAQLERKHRVGNC